jgi:hypothetical protein
MALAYSSAESDRIAALELARQLLTAPIRNARDLNAKLKILETEISNLEATDQNSKFRLLELVALMAQAEISTDERPRSTFLRTHH